MLLVQVVEHEQQLTEQQAVVPEDEELEFLELAVAAGDEQVELQAPGGAEPVLVPEDEVQVAEPVEAQVAVSAEGAAGVQASEEAEAVQEEPVEASGAAAEAVQVLVEEEQALAAAEGVEVLGAAQVEDVAADCHHHRHHLYQVLEA